MATRDAYLGIDLGTTNCALSYYTPGENMKSIKLDNDVLLRSAVDFKETGGCIIGKHAVKQTSDLINGRVVLCNKRLIGRKYNTEDTRKVMNSCRAKVVPDNQGYAAFSIPGVNHIVNPQEVSAKILDHIYNKAKTFLADYTIKGVTVTVPASFDSDQRLATLKAIQMSKFGDNVKLLSEPVAAAISMGIMNNMNNGHILIYDFGGGTFDVSIIELQGGNTFKVIATDGLASVGGEDIDIIIYKDLLDDYSKINEGYGLVDSPLKQTRNVQLEKNKAKIMEDCRDAKEDLSKDGMNMASIDHEWLFDKQADEMLEYDDNDPDSYNGIIMDYVYNLPRDKFQTLIKDLVKKTIQCTRSCMDKAGLEPTNIDRVVMVGGSSRIPFVFEELAKLFPAKRVTRLDPDLCVSRGAAYFSASCGNLLDISFEEGAPFSVFTKVRRSHRAIAYDPIINYGDVLPCTRTKRYLVSDVMAFQDEILLGKSDQDCHHLAYVECSGITVEPNVALMYTFTLTKENLLYYSVTEERTNKVLVRDQVVTEMNM